MHIYDIKRHRLIKRFLMNQKQERLALSKKELKFTENYNIEQVFEEETETKVDPKVDLYRQALKNEEMFWHNNVTLPYQKKIKRD